MADIKPWLKALNFEKKLEIYELKIKDSIITIDIENQKIKYPKLKEIGRETTTNFSKEENFVVLEVVINLLRQGYKPNQISIEKGYKLGHNTKSGNADITVDNNDNEPFLIIEAKTYGTEFEKEWKNTLNDGGQLFSYEKQENKAKVLVLYASHVSNEKIISTYHAINLTDNEDYLKSLDKFRSYKDAKGGNDKFEIWRDVYQQDFLTNGVLEKNIKPFEIGKSKTSIDDLKRIEHDEVQKKYNEFTTILRKYNIGGRENAFDKLVNLFLAKIVDEQQNSDDLQFNWKGVAQDTYFDLVDRLQKLYQIGMEKFLNEEVSYVSKQEVEDAFRLRKDAAKDAILKYFKELKYYSNNDFTFLEVYNEKLFYQNSQILVEVVKMLQNIKLKTKEKNQFLGDLFEGFLDNGVKQSEGQFFTPLPIVKFIVSSLPLKEINAQIDIPKIIDYACGAGHFLNEYAEQLKKYVKQERLQEYYSKIYGIEKEYRLSKVAKVSAFMYGQDNINIIYADALKKDERIKENSYSVVIANPPYSVKGFLEILSESQRKRYLLSNEINNLDTSNSIELFFLERTEQLLKSEGIAGIIFPISILSNGKIYEKARKMLVENFNIIAIVEFSSKTFSSTGTNTIALFLQKKKYPPKESDNFKYAVERWFNNDNVQESDKEIISIYCDFIGVEYEDYQEFQIGKLEKLVEFELFEEYIEEFNKSKKARDINEKKIKNGYTEEIKEEELRKAEFKYIKELEQEKVTYFALAYSQENDVVIVKSPDDSKEIKEFLGYKWSKRKGKEGIKYMGTKISDDEIEISKNQAINDIKTPLFNPLNLDDSENINTIIRNNFNGKLEIIPENLKKFVTTYSLVDMIDFSDTKFDMQIQINLRKKLEIKSNKYPVVKIKNITTDIQKGQTITQTQTKEGNIKVVAGGTDYAYFHNEANREANIITIAASGTAGFVNFWDEPIFASDCITIRGRNIEETKYIYYYLKSQQQEIFNFARGITHKHVYAKDIKKFPIPEIPVEIQREIICKVEKLEEKYQKAKKEIEKYRKEIEKIFKEKPEKLLKLGQIGPMKMCKRIYQKETESQKNKIFEVPFYKIGTLGKIPDAYITKEKFNEYKEKYPFPKKGTILISASGTIGKTYVYNGEDAYFQDSNIVWLENDEKIVSNRYLAKVLPYISWNASDGSTIKRLYGNEFEETEIPIFAYQEHIINNITKLEENIEMEEEKKLRIQEEINKILIEKLELKIEYVENNNKSVNV